MLESLSRKEKMLGGFSVFMALIIVFLGVGLAQANSQIQNLGGEVKNLTEVNEELERSNSELIADIEEANTTIGELERNISNLRDERNEEMLYSLYNASNVARNSMSPADWRGFAKAFKNWSNNQAVSVDLASYGDSYSEEGLYREAGSHYYAASDYANLAKENLITASSHLEDDERESKIRTIINSYQTLSRFYDKYGDLMYAYYRGDNTEASNLETEIEEMREEIEDLSLEMELMDDFWSNEAETSETLGA